MKDKKPTIDRITLDKLKVWRKHAMKHVKSIKNKKRRQAEARRYFEIDRSGTMGPDLRHRWREMENFLEKNDVGYIQVTEIPDYDPDWEIKLARQMEIHYQEQEREPPFPIPESLGKKFKKDHYPVLPHHLPTFEEFKKAHPYQEEPEVQQADISDSFWANWPKDWLRIAQKSHYKVRNNPYWPDSPNKHLREKYTIEEVKEIILKKGEFTDA